MLTASESVYAASGSVYVADEEASTVSVIDTASVKLMRSIPVGQGPRNVHVSPDGKLVWVADNGDPSSADEKPMQPRFPLAT